ncbi:MAG: DUF2341 domain-containing protein, partial [bacterium]|nr:DUF2341 domain-containing protein [bacterium]
MKKRTKRVISALMIVVLVAGSFIAFRPQTAEAAWWNDSWAYRKSIAITNNTSDETNIYIALTLDTSDTTRFKTNCGDLRFTKTNGEVLPYLIVSGCGSASTVVDVNFDTFPAGAQTIYYYYGNPTAADGFTSAWSGAVTSTNMRLSAIDGTAFVDFSAANTLTPYLGSKIVITDSASKKLTGFIKAAGSGETYTELASNGNFETGNPPSGWTAMSSTLAASADANSGSQSIQVTLTSTSGGFRQEGIGYQDSALYNWSVAIKRGTDSSAVARLYLIYNNEMVLSVNAPVSWTTYTGHYIHRAAGAHYLMPYIYGTNTKTTLYDDLSVKQVLTPSITGVTITSTSNGSTYNFASQESGFNYNDNYTYSIYPLAFSVEASNYTVGSLGSEEKGTGPVGYWSFDEGFGTTANDATGNKNNGTLTNMSATASSTSGWQTEDNCVSGKCLAFDGSNDFVNVTNTISANSVAFWVKPTTNTASMINLTSGAYITSASGAITATGFTSPTYYVNGVATASPTLTSGAWNYIVVTTATPISADAVTIGKANGAYTTGKIDEPKIYNYARTAAQIKLDYNAGLAGTSGRAAGEGIGTSIGGRSAAWLSNGLVGHWKMDEASWSGTAGEVIDSSGNGNNGVRSGDATTATGKFGNGGTFDGTGDYLNMGNAASIGANIQNVTMAYWVKQPSAANYQGIVATAASDGKNGYRSGISNTGLTEVLIGDASGYEIAYGTTVMDDNIWRHVVVTVDASYLRVYVNGVLEGVPTARTKTITYSNNLIIGVWSDIDTSFFNG